MGFQIVDVLLSLVTVISLQVVHVAGLHAPLNVKPAELHHHPVASLVMLSGTILLGVGVGPWHTDDPAALNVPRGQFTHVV